MTLSISFAAPLKRGAATPKSPDGFNPVGVIGSTGVDGGYATLQAAFDALNANTIQTGNAIRFFPVSALRFPRIRNSQLVNPSDTRPMRHNTSANARMPAAKAAQLWRQTKNSAL